MTDDERARIESAMEFLDILEGSSPEVHPGKTGDHGTAAVATAVLRDLLAKHCATLREGLGCLKEYGS